MQLVDLVVYDKSHIDILETDLWHKLLYLFKNIFPIILDIYYSKLKWFNNFLLNNPKPI